MHFLITAIGSYGDVHPMVGLGAALASRGQRVSLVANPYFEELIRQAGLEFLPLDTRERYLEFVHHPDLWHPVRGYFLAFRFGCLRLLPDLYELVTKHYVAGETVLGAHGLDLASRIAAEKLQAPIASINFAPASFVSAYQTARMPRVLWWDPVPRWIKRCNFWFGERYMVEPLLGPEVNGLRHELGLPPVRNFITKWWHATDLVLGLFPDWFAAPQPDWPSNTVCTGFPLWDGAAHNSIPPEVDAFLDDGDPPIVFTPGSAHADARDFFAAAADACGQLGRRGILLTKFSDHLPDKLPPSVRHCGFVPLSQVLPRAAAFVHHGGIGSCARGLAAGVPQLVRPLGFDQFDNSLRLRRLGVSEEIAVREFRGPAVAAAVDRMLESAEVRNACQQYANRCDGTAALNLACDALESLAPATVAR